MEDTEIMMVSIKELAPDGTMGDLCRSLEAGPVDGKEIVLDFNGVKEVRSSDAEDLMSTCLKLKEQGTVIRLKGMSLTVRDQFLLSAINNARDEILL
jgi:MFS superfamily sulfate permease-like transporter